MLDFLLGGINITSLQIQEVCATLGSMQATRYRYRYNGKEQLSRFGGRYDYGFRMYDAGLARFLSVDPLTKKYPELTPYQFGSNRPIDGIDLDGLEYSPVSILRSEVAKVRLAASQQLKQSTNAIKAAGEKSLQRFSEVYNNPTVQGAIGVAGGVASMVAGTALLLTPEPTGLTKAGGAYQIVQGFAGITLGMAKIADAQEENSNRVIEGGLISQVAAGVDPKDESNIVLGANLLELGLGYRAGKISDSKVSLPRMKKNAGDVSQINDVSQIAIKVEQKLSHKNKGGKK